MVAVDSFFAAPLYFARGDPLKRELPPAVMAAIAAVAVLVIGGLGWTWFNGQVNPGEDLELAKKQAEFERSRTPRGEGATTPLPNTPEGQSGFSPGRESELEARQKTGN